MRNGMVGGCVLLDYSQIGLEASWVEFKSDRNERRREGGGNHGDLASPPWLHNLSIFLSTTRTPAFGRSSHQTNMVWLKGHAL